ncbi:MAG: hypothetical protein DMG21_15410 [Acidobacteria bacterium]|nr:MAG: hypothetical protein DMG21_15410 [Acidobacteriota bacterium]
MVAPILLNLFSPFQIRFPLRILFKPEIYPLKPSCSAFSFRLQLEKVAISEQVSPIHLTSLKKSVVSLGMHNLQFGTPSERRGHLSR